MGQTLSCVSKQKKQPKEDLKKSNVKALFKKQKGTVVIKEEDSSKKPQTGVLTATTATNVDKQVNHLQSDNEPELLRKRSKLVLLIPAPPHAKFPVPIAPQPSNNVSPPLEKASFVSQTNANRASPAAIHKPQTVDQVARDLAQGDARPATWNDLYWTLVGSRGLKSDSEIIKALFSWLCSIPLDRDAFVTMEELEQAVKEGVPFAEEAKLAKSKSMGPDSPEVVVNELTRGKLTYLRAFESLCRYASIPCCTIKGLAKGVDYTVGMNLTNQPLPPENADTTSPISRIQHAWSAAYVDGKWALFDSMWAAERLAMSANARLSQIAEVGRMEYETDMFYFNADPAIFIHSHFPFEDNWQLLKPPMTLEQFQNGVLLKPAFFTHGLGLFSHQEGVVPVQSKLILKLSVPPSLVKLLLFTFNLKLDGQDELIKGVNLSRFGMHEISVAEALVTFSFRFPKSGAYKLTIYARKVGDPLFTDVCEYRVEAKGSGAEPTTTEPQMGSIEIHPFPPTSQSSYGPTEKANELKVQPIQADMPAVAKCSNGVFEVRFRTTEPSIKLPRMTARLKSLLHDSSMLTDCILVRVVQACQSQTLASISSDISASSSFMNFPTCLITVYLPSAGEYALEVYGAPADADEDTSYFLVWQFLIDADCGVKLSTPVRKRLATTILGPRDSNWDQLGLQTISHPDPLIHVPTKGTAVVQKARSKSELMQQFVKHSEKLDRERHSELLNGVADTLQVTDERENTSAALEEDEAGPRSCDLKIVLGKPRTKKLCIVGELVDITEPVEASNPGYLLQQVDELDDVEIGSKTSERITYLIRIPKGDHFYKFHLYAAMVDSVPACDLPLVYTYVIEAPQRLMAAEVPYVGVKHGPFPEKLEHQQKQQQQVQLQSKNK